MSQVKVNTIVDAAGGNTVTVNGYTPTMSNMAGRNRIINGDMRIDQRNGGASVPVTSTASTYATDRWMNQQTAASKITIQQNQGSVTAPAGFTSYHGTTTTTAFSVTASDYFLFSQGIEGYNIADLNWGTANAKTVTLSFWVRSSLTGTFGGSLDAGSSGGASYPFAYSIPTANTWTKISITISGPTIGTWGSTNSVGVFVRFGLGVGSAYSGTAGAWSSNRYFSATGATSVVGTSGATFYITGVQLEEGSVATPFEHRLYGQELALCQRYYILFDMTAEVGLMGMAGSTTFGLVQYSFPVTMRAAPTLGTTGNAGDYRFRYGGSSFKVASTVPALTSATVLGIRIDTNVASGLTAGQTVVLSAVTSAPLTFSAEL